MLNDLPADLNASNRSGGIVRISATASRIDRPSPLSEPDDVVRVDFHLPPLRTGRRVGAIRVSPTSVLSPPIQIILSIVSTHPLLSYPCATLGSWP